MNINSCTFSGNLGHDPEVRTVGSQDKPVKVCSFNLAVGSRKRNKAGEWTNATTWVRFVAWGWQADSLERFAKKGDKLTISAEYQVREYIAEGGVVSYAHEFVVRELDITNLNRHQGKAEELADAPAAQHPGLDSFQVVDIPNQDYGF